MMIITMIIILETFLPPLVMTNYQLSLKITVSTLKIMVLPRTTVLIAYRICTCFGVVRWDRVIPWETFFGTYGTVRTTPLTEYYWFFSVFLSLYFSLQFLYFHFYCHTLGAGKRSSFPFSIFPFPSYCFFVSHLPLFSLNFPQFPSIPPNSLNFPSFTSSPSFPSFPLISG